MATFLSRALRYLDGVYQIRGSRVLTDEIDLAAVQLVQDVGSLMTSGRALGLEGRDSYFVARIGIDVDDAAAPSTPEEVLTLNPYDQGGGLGGSLIPDEIPDDYYLWLYGVGASHRVFVSGSSVTSIAPWLRLDTDFVGVKRQNSATITSPYFSLGRFQTGNLSTDTSGNQLRLWAPSDLNGAIPGIKSWPLLIPRTAINSLGVVVDFDLPGTDDGSKAVEVWVDFLLRAVPRGMHPGP